MTSDYAALHEHPGAVDGTDMEQPFNTFFGPALQADVENGTIPESVVDTMVSRIATEMFRFGIFNHPPTGTTGATVTTPAHQAVGTASPRTAPCCSRTTAGSCRCRPRTPARWR